MNWTPDRPTKPGKYWLSVHPSKRPGEQRPDVMFPHAIACEVTQVVEWMLGEDNANALDHEQRRFVWAVKYLSGGAWLRLSDSWFDDAQWRPYVEPPDPFAEPVPKPIEQLPSDAARAELARLTTPRPIAEAPKESAASDSAVFLVGSPASDLRALAASARELAPFVSSSREENEAYARGVTDGQMVLAHRLLLLSSADWPCSTTQLRGNPLTPDANRATTGRLLVHWACSTCGLRAAGTLAELNAAGMAWLKNAWQVHESACAQQSASRAKARTGSR